jgi:RNA polymerase sigma factor (sigma-70 family)
MDDSSDETLVVRARQGDQQAFAVLLDRCRPTLLKLCRRVLGDALLAEDAAQEASLQAYLNLDRLQHPAQFHHWLNAIGLNVCRQMLRMRSRDYWSWEALVGGSYVQEPVDLRPSPTEQAEHRDLQERIRYAVTALPPGQRAAVMLFYLSGLSYAETASLLGIGMGAVRTRLHKARTTLQKTLWTTWLEDEMADDGTTEMVEMHIRDVWQTPANGNKPRQILVVLEETGGERRFPIWIGRPEGEALAVALEQMETPRPLTYAFMATLLQATGAGLHEVRISRLAERTFFAEVVVEGPAGRRIIDARPSDALNLAVRTGTPIRAAAEVIAQASRAITWDEACREMQEHGVSPEHLPSHEEFEQINTVVRGETSGGAAAIVAELCG